MVVISCVERLRHCGVSRTTPRGTLMPDEAGPFYPIKHITFLTDAELMHAAIKRLNRVPASARLAGRETSPKGSSSLEGWKETGSARP
jgi:hypothetical protein